jgi:hypothetical protein
MLCASKVMLSFNQASVLHVQTCRTVQAMAAIGVAVACQSYLPELRHVHSAAVLMSTLKFIFKSIVFVGMLLIVIYI